MSESDEERLPDVGTCASRVRDFVEVTGTDEACAQFYLQDRDWDLQRSVDAYFQAKSSSGVVVLDDEDEPQVVVLDDGDEPQVVVNMDQRAVSCLEGIDSTARMESLAGDRLTQVPPAKFSMISWNLDGLNDKNLKKRTKAVVKILEIEKPDIVFFQELIPETYSYLETKLQQYMFFAGNSEGYFTGILLRKFVVYYDCHEIIEFKNSIMGRNLLIVEAHIGPKKLLLMNTHLESTAEHSSRRMLQLKKAFKMVKNASTDKTVIFGGDLNLRDKEVSELGGPPAGIEDLWQKCGSRDACRYTWDAQRNSNIDFQSHFRPRLRFDRLYLRSSQPCAVIPRHFGLVGIQKVEGTQSFPSDHWGIVVFFEDDKTS